NRRSGQWKRAHGRPEELREHASVRADGDLPAVAPMASGARVRLRRRATARPHRICPERGHAAGALDARMDRSPRRDMRRGGGEETMTASVILPTYNERETIVTVIDEILAAVPDVDVLVVDDDSPDQTWAIVERTFTGDARVRVLRRIGRRGLPSAL